MLDDKDVLEAVQRRLGAGSPVAVTLPGAAEVTWHPLLEGAIERCIESRRQDGQRHDGRIDLSDRPVYDSLAGISLDPPAYPYTPMTRKLVRRGSVEEKLCDCGNGQVACQRCRGQGDLPCEASVPCAACHGIDPCTRCHGTGRRKGQDRAGAVTPPADLVGCKRCGAAETACPGCRGQGRVPCPVCEGKGKRDCPDCRTAGTVPHKSCGGTGGTVTWTEAVITRTPKKVAIRLSETRPARPARLLARHTGDWSTTTLAPGDPLPPHLAKEFTTLQSDLAAEPDEIARRATLRYLPLARVRVHQLADRVYYVFPRNDTLRVRALPSRHRTWQIAAAALAALALLVLLANLL
ncbi:hypothetical protein [Streptomyces sp. NPDC049040]|uniref:hypothetical protein n=1 Tax=Streptomyces sp. NPDC049040 TaxID=3365593 RepID=UPI0037195064